MTAKPTSMFNIQVGNDLTWNVRPLLHEIRHALHDLAENDEPSIIDLRSIPLAPGEEEKIINTLGCGEVHARLNALGPSEIVETQYPGVWVITHYNDDNEIIGRFIEITAMPAILRSQAEDIRNSYEQLSDFLEDADNNQALSVERTQ